MLGKTRQFVTQNKYLLQTMKTTIHGNSDI